jgi:hypothetical protein
VATVHALLYAYEGHLVDPRNAGAVYELLRRLAEEDQYFGPEDNEAEILSEIGRLGETGILQALQGD